MVLAIAKAQLSNGTPRQKINVQNLYFTFYIVYLGHKQKIKKEIGTLSARVICLTI
jgi:hypothetical protein